MAGVQTIVGIDEAGRGPLAGPVYVGIAAVSQTCDLSRFSKLTDSKQMSEASREAIFDQIADQDIAGLQASITHTKASTIDAIGINSAIQRAINRGLRKLDINTFTTQILLDGGLHAPDKYRQKAVKKGDQKHPEISLASVLAKVARDRYMKKIDEQYDFDFASHKGYGTQKHRKQLNEIGTTRTHRKTFTELN